MERKKEIHLHRTIKQLFREFTYQYYLNCETIFLVKSFGNHTTRKNVISEGQSAAQH